MTTPEERAIKLCRGMWQARSNKVDISQDEEVKAIAAAIWEAVAAEREACAKIAADCAYIRETWPHLIVTDPVSTARAIEAEIRARNAA